MHKNTIVPAQDTLKKLNPHFPLSTFVSIISRFKCMALLKLAKITFLISNSFSLDLAFLIKNEDFGAKLNSSQNA